jgi:hypothetical protein
MKKRARSYSVRFVDNLAVSKVSVPSDDEIDLDYLSHIVSTSAAAKMGSFGDGKFWGLNPGQNARYSWPSLRSLFGK